MAKLIAVHNFRTSKKFLLNCDQIEYAHEDSTSAGFYTFVKMVSGESHTISESLDDLNRLSVQS